MKLYHDHFHCFGCGKSGDVIALIAQRLNISQFESAKVLINDFRETFVQVPQSNWVQRHAGLSEYLGYLQRFKTLYTPKSEHEPINSLHAIPRAEYYLDILTFESLEVRQQFLQEFVKQLDGIEIKLDEYRRTHPRRKE